MEKPLVSICCTTYNHAQFIRQCLDGFMMQQTSFPFEVLIHDDASTDGTADIIREYEAKYPGIIKPIYQTENQYSKGVKISATYQFPRAQGKYIAMCEGDDYWTDPHKLQKQVDFLESNPGYSLCSHCYSIYDEETREWSLDDGGKFLSDGVEGITFDYEFNLLKVWLAQTLTMVFRRESLELSVFSRYKFPMNVHLIYHVLKNGKGYCFNFNAAVYREHTGGVWAKKTSRYQASKAYENHKELYTKNKNDSVLKKIARDRLVRYYNSVIKPDIAEKKITKEIFLRLVSFVRDELRLFGLKHIKTKMLAFLTGKT